MVYLNPISYSPLKNQVIPTTKKNSPKSNYKDFTPLSFQGAMALKASVLSFKGNDQKIQIAEETFNLIDQLIKSDQKLDKTNPKHIQTILKLEKNLGGKEQTVKNPENPEESLQVNNELTIDNINKGENLEILHKTLATMISASKNNPVIIDMGTRSPIHVNNSELVSMLKPTYTIDQFKTLYQTLENHGVFNIQTQPVLGIPKTSGVTAGEDFEMGARYWVTDTCHNIKMMKEKTPDDVPKALKTMARFYKENEPAIQYFIDNPIKDNANNKDHPINMIKNGNLSDAKLRGVPHIFIPIEDPDSPDGIKLKPDEDFNRWRQESHGNALKALVSGIREGVIEGKNTGLKKEAINNDIKDTIGNLVSYFKSVDYPHVPSGGNWEEKPFEQGLTYDTAVITDALKATKQLMNDLDRPEFKDVRDSLINSANGSILSDNKEFDELIRIGEERIKKTYTEEAPSEGDLDSRAIDASQIFTVKIATFDDDPIKNAEKKLDVLKNVENKLVGDFGIARYNEVNIHVGNKSLIGGDSYLGPNYDIAIDQKGDISLGYFNIKDQFGSKDCSTPELFAAREQICGGDKKQTAQWFFDPVMASAYGKIKEDLLKAGVPKDHEMIKKASNKQVEYLNKGIARVTGKKEDGTKHLKSNGYESPEWAIPEAYQSVTALSNGKENQMKFVVGRNSPLTWAETELHQACKQYEKGLKQAL